ncbi:MAG: Npt1/Npt2 family nucleotide transporter, partial [Myxococcota bacterium]
MAGGRTTLLESAFRIRPGEARLVGIMFAYLLAIVSTFIIGRTVRDTLFLHRVALESLPLMYVAVAAAVSLASYAYSRVADGLRRDRLVVRSLGLFTGVILAFYALLRAGVPGDWPYALLYVAVEIIGALSMIQFWTLAGDVFSGRQAKRLFGFIGAGGVLANVVCGFAVGALAPAIGAEQLLIVVAALFLASAGLVRAAAGVAADDLERAIQKPRGRGIGVARDSGAVLHNTHLKLIAALVVVTFLTVTVVDYQFKVVARTSLLSEAQLAAFFGNFYGVAGIIACLTQFFVTGRLIERAGLIPALLVLPGMMALGVVSMAFVPFIGALFAVTIAKGAENIF